MYAATLLLINDMYRNNKRPVHMYVYKMDLYSIQSEHFVQLKACKLGLEGDAT